MPAGFRRHLVGKTLRNVCYCDIAQVCLVGNLMVIRTFLINQRIEFYQNNTTNLRNLTQLITRCYTHKMSIVS